MGLTCNIDARGKFVRLVYGIILLIAGVILTWLWARPSGSALAWIICALILISGAFAVFEARAGWCVMRAMGFKTPV